MHPQARLVLRRADSIPHCLVEVQKQWEVFFFKEESGKMVYEYHIQGKTTTFLKNPECGTDAF
jgi:hypothetical protein